MSGGICLGGICPRTGGNVWLVYLGDDECLGHLCWLELEGEGCMFYLLYPLIICPILDILMLQVTGQQLGLLIRG